MYDSLFNPTVLVISFAIYSLLLMCLLLAVKVVKLERKNRKHIEYILYINDRVSKLEDETK